MDAGIDIAKHSEFLRVLAGRGRADMLDWLLTDNVHLRASINDDPLGYGPPLFAAISSASTKAAHALLKNGADANHAYGRTPLGEALGCFRDAPEILYTLLEKGADVNMIGDAGYSPLLLASEEVAIPGEVLSLFLEKGADVNRVCELEMAITPLHAACRRGNLAAVRRLLAHGAHPNVVSEFGLVPLHFATQRGYAAIVRELLSHGADPNIEGDVGCRALCLAMSCRSRAAAALLLQYGANPHKTYSHESPLTLAIESGELDLVQMILGAGVDIIELEHDDVLTALAHPSLDILQLLWDILSRRTCNDPSVGALRYMVCAGGDYDVMMMDYQGENYAYPFFDERNYSIPHLVAFYGNTSFLTLLLAEGLRLGSEGWLSPLHAAAWAGHVSIVEALLRHGANAMARTASGMTAMMGAAIEGHVEVVRALLAFSAKLGTTDAAGNTALHYAAMHGKASVLELLMEFRGDVHQVNGSGLSVVDCAWNQPGVIQFLRTMPQVDLGAVDENGRTLLAKAAGAGLADVVEALFADADSDMSVGNVGTPPRLIGNIADNRGTLPVFAAVQSRDWETLWRLLIVQDDILQQKDFADQKDAPQTYRYLDDRDVPYADENENGNKVTLESLAPDEDKSLNRLAAPEYLADERGPQKANYYVGGWQVYYQPRETGDAASNLSYRLRRCVGI
ncbi:ankyrin repeats (3 copies) domain-containing protein [Cordyceps javanica]|uniref:Ankyrin repeats (3 copies) domain-containing protein n=1 Tax=Cordyceps javanica TaxID=43265 RepID=A0A545UL01_9HYPO|nr:ankyrin repeats (3 copies) domain-containing protein [Cordyceps javanica]TQW01632.1 ankyrin repeats (3 copies) domain-containing protein [Cordyceps javanica]